MVSSRGLPKLRHVKASLSGVVLVIESVLSLVYKEKGLAFPGGHAMSDEVCEYCQVELGSSSEHECLGVFKIARRGSIGTITAGDGEGSIRCRFCPALFLRRRNFNKHMKIHLRPHKCEECQLRFSEKREYNRHIDTHARQFSDSVECEACGITFTRKDNLEKHIRLLRCRGKRPSQE